MQLLYHNFTYNLIPPTGIESNNVTMLATMMSIHGEVNEIKDGTQAQKNKQPENVQMPQNMPNNIPPAQ